MFTHMERCTIRVHPTYPSTWHRRCIASTSSLVLARQQCRRRAVVRSASNSDSGPAQVLGSTQWVFKQSLALALASAVLGPLCDGQHSSHDVLHYVHPTYLSVLGLEVETCWWVPCMFAVAGIILGTSHPLLDAWLPDSRPRSGTDPSWGVVLLGIAAFVVQYGASGMLEQPLMGQTLGPLPTLDVLLAGVALVHWAVLDGTRQGLGMACLTALAGPAVEIALINVFHLYHYTHPHIFGVPTWIPEVYFCGSTAVGCLGRKVSAVLVRQQQSA